MAFPILNRINQIPRIDTHLFKTYSNIAFPIYSWAFLIYLFPVGLPAKILKALVPSSILVTYPTHPFLLDLILNIIHECRFKCVINSMVVLSCSIHRLGGTEFYHLTSRTIYENWVKCVITLCPEKER